MKKDCLESLLRMEILKTNIIADTRDQILIDFDDVLTKFKTKKKSLDSEQDKINRAIKYLFIGSSLGIILCISKMDIQITHAEVLGMAEAAIDTVDYIGNKTTGSLNETGSYIYKEFIKEPMQLGYNEVVSKLNTEEIRALKENVIEWLLEMNMYFDPTKIDYTKILQFMGGFANGILSIELASKIKRRPSEEKIALFADPDIEVDYESTRYAINKYKKASSEYKYKKAFYKILESKNMPLMVVDLITDLTSHILNPKNTMKKIWIKTRLAINETYLIKKIRKEASLVHDKLHLNNDLSMLNISLSNIEISKKIHKELFDVDPELSVTQRESLKTDLIYKSNKEAYEEILKINTKRALKKAIFIVGNKTKKNSYRKEALNKIKEISKIDQKTKDNNFNDYAILSKIAENYLNKIEETKKIQIFETRDLVENFIEKEERRLLKNKDFMIQTVENGFIIDERKKIKKYDDFDDIFERKLKENVKIEKINIIEKKEIELKKSQRYVIE